MKSILAFIINKINSSTIILIIFFFRKGLSVWFVIQVCELLKGKIIYSTVFCTCLDL